MPGVVDADEDAQAVGRKVDGVALPPGVEIDDTVAADAPVEHLQWAAGIFGEQIPGDFARVTGSKGLVMIGDGFLTAIPSAIGDRVALEKKGFTLVDVHGGTGIARAPRCAPTKTAFDLRQRFMKRLG